MEYLFSYQLRGYYLGEKMDGLTVVGISGRKTLWRL